MEILINTDNHIKGSENFIQDYKSQLQKSLKRFEEYLTSVEVYFSDENKAKKGIDDKKCVIEARVKGKNAESASHNADTLKHAFDGALEKIKSILTRIAEQYKSH